MKLNFIIFGGLLFMAQSLYSQNTKEIWNTMQGLIKCRLRGLPPEILTTKTRMWKDSRK